MNEVTKTIIALIILFVLVVGVVYSFNTRKNVRLKNDPAFPKYVYSSDKSLLSYRIAITIPDHCCPK